MNKCLYCYGVLAGDETDYHQSCSKKIFGQPIAPELPYSEKEMAQLAMQVIKSQVAVTGVQPKLSLELNAGNNKSPKRFTIAGLWGNYILKPATPHYPQLPEVEDLTMHLATIAKISVVPHSLIRLKSGTLAYITKRIDRTKKDKVHMEDMCQLTERLTEDKYHGSYEQIAKAIVKYSTNPGLDLVNFSEQILFCFLTGNADMHLKNFSLIHQPGIGPALSPSYDLVATRLVNPGDKEDTALTLNGKKNRIGRSDFVAAYTSMRLDEKQQENIFNKMNRTKEKWLEFIDISFLSSDFKDAYKGLLNERFERLS